MDKNTDGRIVVLTDRILRNLQQNWTVKDLAESIKLSESHLQKLFKNTTGMSPIKYVKHLRCEKAVELLKDKKFEACSSIPCDLPGQLQLFENCGNSLNSTVQAYPNRDNFCGLSTNDREDQCNPADPNYFLCMSLADETYIQCIHRIENTYNNRYPDYGSCVTGMDSIMYDPNICTVPFDPCPDIEFKVDQCRLVFPATDPFSDPEVYDAQTACIESLPHVVQSKGGLTCPGTGYIPQ